MTPRWLLVTIAIVGMGQMRDPHTDTALFLVVKFIALVLLANVIGRLAIRWLRRSKLCFIRRYENQ